MYEETTLELPPPSQPRKDKLNGVKPGEEEQLTPILQVARGDQRMMVGAGEGVTVSNATACWGVQVSDDTLSHINLRVVPGMLTAIIGPVGSGKVRYCSTHFFKTFIITTATFKNIKLTTIYVNYIIIKPLNICFICEILNNF